MQSQTKSHSPAMFEVSYSSLNVFPLGLQVAQRVEKLLLGMAKEKKGGESLQQQILTPGVTVGI